VRHYASAAGARHSFLAAKVFSPLGATGRAPVLLRRTGIDAPATFHLPARSAMTHSPSDTRVPCLAVGCRIRALSAEETMLLVPEGALRLKGAASEIIGRSAQRASSAPDGR
jgi:hypothetical protein